MSAVLNAVRFKMLIALAAAAALAMALTAVAAEFRTPQPVEAVLYADPVPQGEKIDINTASAEQLKTLDGIGDVLARRIIEYREMTGGFTDIIQLLNVKGIGNTNFNKIKFYIKAGD